MSVIDKLKKMFLRNVDFDISETQIFALGESPTALTPIPKTKYRCRLITKNKRTMTFAVCILNDMTLTYLENDVVSLVYSEFRKTYVFTATIDSVIGRRGLSPIDMDLFEAYIGTSILRKCEVVLLSLIVTSTPKEYDRRHFKRYDSPPWKIYFKVRDTSYNSSSAEADSVPSAQLALLESGRFEIGDNQYCIIKAIDISGGGFKSQIELEIPERTVLNCIVELNDKQRYYVTGEVLDYVLPYQMRVQFIDVSMDDRNSIVKNILAVEKQNKQG